MQSCIYEGRVSHARRAPVLHRFAYRVFMMYLDLDELPAVFDKRWFWSTHRPALARFRRKHHLGPADQPLADSLRELVLATSGIELRGPIRLLTNLSYYGYCFNPVSYYYCFNASGRAVDVIVAEVTNTPWGERSTYVLPVRIPEKPGSVFRCRKSKSMHVSPFMPMDMKYDWCFTNPEQRLAINMANLHKGKRVFDASVVLERTEISTVSLARTLLQYPFMTAKVVAAIHWQAMRLWLKGCPVYEHPKKRQKIAATSQ